jgi:endo-1,4-beta-xylanase
LISISIQVSYQEDDYQITVTFENEVSFNGKDEIKEFESLAVINEGGYQVQVKIPLTTKQIIGFDLQVNDSNEHGVRQSIATWNDLTGALPYSTTGFGNLIFQK